MGNLFILYELKHNHRNGFLLLRIHVLVWHHRDSRSLMTYKEAQERIVNYLDRDLSSAFHIRTVFILNT